MLRRGLDTSKDQSYVLFGVARSLLPRMMFPVGGHRKEEIRRIARDLDMRVADKKDSQEICFVAAGEHADFVRRRGSADDTSGEIVTTNGTVVGRHEGIESFTIGQRKGLGVALGEPRYVVRLEAESHRVVIGMRDELARAEFFADRTNWLAAEPSLHFVASLKSGTTARRFQQPSNRFRTPAFTCDSTSLNTASLRAKPSCATTATASSAAAGSSKVRRDQ